MPVTTRSNLVIPEILADAVAGAWPDRIALAGNRAVIESATLPGNARGGDKLTVPYFGVIGEFEDVAEGAALTPAPLSMTTEEANVVRSGKAFEITTWAQLAAQFADPYGEAARQIVEGARRRFDAALVSAAAAAPLTGPDIPGPGAMVHDAAGPISYDALIDALGKFEDESQEVAAVVVHPKIRDDLRKLKDANGLPLFSDPREGGQVPMVLGLPLVVSSRAPVTSGTPDTYTTLFVKRGALALWYNGTPRVETDRDILVDSDVMAVNVYYLVHRYGRLPGSRLPGVLQLITT